MNKASALLKISPKLQSGIYMPPNAETLKPPIDWLYSMQIPKARFTTLRAGNFGYVAPNEWDTHGLGFNSTPIPRTHRHLHKTQSTNNSQSTVGASAPTFHVVCRIYKEGNQVVVEAIADRQRLKPQIDKNK